MKKDKKNLLLKVSNEWHPMKNKGLQPDQFSSGSGKKVWWQCNKGHEWEAQIRSRYMGINCPLCNGRLPSSKRNLKVLYPQLAKEWFLPKNISLTPTDVTPGSAKKVWWQCDKNHQWEATIASRAKGSNCPECVGKKVGKDNNLLFKFPKIAKEWHSTKNRSLTPKDITSGSNKRVWWKCIKGHEWEARIASRAINKTNCPECLGRKAGKDNNLQFIYPKVAKEWHPTKNKTLTPKDITARSSKKVWWICKNGHEWLSVIRFRTQRGTGCPVCSGHKAGKNNNLAVQFPQIAKEWHPTKNGDLTPKDVTYGSGKQVWWKCSKGHNWQTTAVSRSKGKSCPYCGRQKRI